MLVKRGIRLVTQTKQKIIINLYFNLSLFAGWESQLLECGFIAIFLVPALSLRKLNLKSPPSLLTIYLYRWLIFRIMLGAGLIKIRGDKCWTDLTCMNYHYEVRRF